TAQLQQVRDVAGQFRITGSTIVNLVELGLEAAEIMDGRRITAAADGRALGFEVGRYRQDRARPAQRLTVAGEKLVGRDVLKQQVGSPVRHEQARESCHTVEPLAESCAEEIVICRGKSKAYQAGRRKTPATAIDRPPSGDGA